ncbi:MAG: hypothetical protein IPI67_32695 [Myxococcales bacterium]|nr:hypothetical protein [Myxococcales bacterium]
MSNAPRAAIERPVRLEIEALCAACQRPVGLGAPVLRSACSACGEPVELTSASWAHLFAEIDEKSFDLPPTDHDTRVAEQATPEGKLVARYTMAAPSCAKCRAEIMLVEPGTDDVLECAACATKMTTFQVPGWLRTDLPTAMQLYGASRDSQASATPFWLTFQGTPPVRGEQRRNVIQAAIGPGPELSGIPSRPLVKPVERRRWEWYVIIVIVGIIVAGVRECGRRAARSTDRDRDNAVESTP